MTAYKLTFSGKVQGVFYRDFVQKNAEDLSLTGWVKNEPDRTVSAFVQGEEAAIQELIRKCWEGPPSAKTENIEKTGSDEDPAIEGFEVTY